MRALCSKSIFHVFSVKTPTRLAKKDNPPPCPKSDLGSRF